MQNSISFPVVVADIGGTNARFGIATGNQDKDNRFIIDQQQVYPCSEYDQFDVLFKKYLDSIQPLQAQYACIAIAAPIIGDQVSMTNLDWSFSVNGLCQKNNMKKIHVVNDFGALAYSTLYLRAHELKTIYKGSDNDVDSISHTQSRAIIGPGTGLGVAGLINTHSGWHPVCGEGGHMSFATMDPSQFKIRETLLSILKTQHLSIEDVLSGPGLVNLYQAICHINNEQVKPLTAAEISAKATEKSDENCIKTLTLFTKILGASAGDIALSMGAFGGVYFSGGILPKVIDAIDTDLLTEHYLNKGIKQDLLKNIPIYLVSAPMPALTGAAHLMFDLKH